MKDFLCLIFVIAFSIQGFAETQNETKPKDYFIYELAAAEAGSFLGGALGFVTGALIVDGIGGGCASFICTDFSILLQPVQIGRALGAVAGAAWLGHELGVEGNVWGAFALTGIWVAMSFDPLFGFFSEFCSITPSIHDSCSGVLSTIWFFPGIPALLATVGYNINASIKALPNNSSSNWSINLPLVQFQF